ncbi:MAG: nucleotidyltransferase domain-containing protein, partial [Acidobacteriota bacterium]|nr:nucleotidyltransferase domain-containing protein [Acidobacteriota bacterium]
MATDVSTHPAIGKLLKGLKTTVPENLVSVVLYGSAARGEYEKSSSDLNIAIVVEELTPTTLEALSGPIKKWVRGGQPAPRLLSPSIIRESVDV